MIGKEGRNGGRKRSEQKDDCGDDDDVNEDNVDGDNNKSNHNSIDNDGVDNGDGIDDGQSSSSDRALFKNVQKKQTKTKTKLREKGEKKFCRRRRRDKNFQGL